MLVRKTRRSINIPVVDYDYKWTGVNKLTGEVHEHSDLAAVLRGILLLSDNEPASYVLVKTPVNPAVEQQQFPGMEK